MSGLKIAIIGGGSSYTPEIIEGFIVRHHELPISEIHLVDIPAGKEKLEIVGALAQRMVKKAGLDTQVILTMDRRRAIEGADFVTTQFRVGLLDARARDERIPLRYKTIGQETNGAGGFAKALRTIPVILDITRDMAELAPTAKLVNFTNPSGMVTEAALRYSKIDTIGLCNVPVNMKMAVAKLFEVEPEEVFVEVAGLNHLIWGLKVWVSGKDVTEKTLELWGNPDSFTMKNIKGVPWGEEFLKTLRLLPCPYHRYYYKTEHMLEEELKDAAPGGKGTRAEVVKAVEAELFDLYKDEKLAIKPPQLMLRGGAYYSDAACNLIASIHNNKMDMHVVNVRNNGAIADLPYDCAIETNAVVGGFGARPLTVGHVPLQIRGLLQEMKAFEQLTIEAAVSGDYHTALQALLVNPLIPNFDVAKALLDDIIRENAEFLPQFTKK